MLPFFFFCQPYLYYHLKPGGRPACQLASFIIAFKVVCRCACCCIPDIDLVDSSCKRLGFSEICCQALLIQTNIVARIARFYL